MSVSAMRVQVSAGVLSRTLAMHANGTTDVAKVQMACVLATEHVTRCSISRKEAELSSPPREKAQFTQIGKPRSIMIVSATGDGLEQIAT